MRWFGKLVCALTLLVSFGLDLGYAAPYSSTGTINDNQVRVRAEPNTSADVLGKLDRGTAVDVVDLDNFQSANSGVDYWVKVQNNGLAGWVFGSYVDIDGKLILDYETYAGDDKALSSYESDVFVVSPKATLFGSDLVPSKTVVFGTELRLAMDTWINLPDIFKTFLTKKFVVEDHQVNAYCPVVTPNDSQLYLIAERDLSVTFLSSPDSTLFLQRSYVFSTNYKFSKQLFILPKPSLIEMRGGTRRVLWASPTSISQDFLKADYILSFTLYEGLFLCHRTIYGERIGSGGGFTTSVDVMKNDNGVLKTVKSLELLHAEG